MHARVCVWVVVVVVGGGGGAGRQQAQGVQEMLHSGRSKAVLLISCLASSHPSKTTFRPLTGLTLLSMMGRTWFWMMSDAFCRGEM